MSLLRRAPRRALALVVATVAACASTEESGVLPPDEQYAVAVRAYEQGDYREAIEALQTFSFNYPQDPRIVDVRWLTAEAYGATEDWATAAQQYLDFQRDFPREARAPEALYLAGRAYQRMSLRPELDQRDTERAINVYERVPVEYPNSERVADARERIQELRDKLAEKTYLNAEFYFDNEDYEAAEIYLTDLVEMYSDTGWLPAGYALLARTFCAQGLSERAARAHRTLRQEFPDSDAGERVAPELAPACRAAALEGGR